MTIVDICVHMDCQGCERKIRKALQKVEGVEQVEIDLERQKVTVTGWVDQNKVLKAVRKTGRKAVIWPYGYSNGNTYTSQQYYNNQQYHPALAQNSMSYRDANNSSSTPSHNYYKHGYGGGYDNSREHGNYGYHYQPEPAPLMYRARVGQRTEDMFSDENPNACSIM
ncbi:heavy metal-associated isoprenylated plant protein 26-like protein [Carex littledalei]|uniref:Heavy metal-associated isoprenylated plant protein 26-like protein n=1 Tax=Carex littledalei TaxID=544730 RepID=A0A833RB61_9POAL|nr:heavy metal-associated isoprenylated plant protein 26-like protein [Carex littledalei]